MTALVRLVRIDGAEEGPLSGQKMVVKANIAVAGCAWDGASSALTGMIADEHAPSVARALKAGASIVGQANMHELAFGITSDNAAFGAVESPYGGMAGGSSGGTAAAVAGGVASLGLGTDTGGSGRLPAAFCGVIGFRPSTGRYPGGGVLTLSSSLDTVSIMASDIEAVSRFDVVLAGETVATEAVLLRGMRLGRINDPFWARLDGSVRRIAEQTLDRLSATGAVIEPRDAPGLPDAVADIAMPLVIAEAHRWWGRFTQERLGIGLTEFASYIASQDVAEIFQAIAADTTDDATLDILRRAGVERVRSILSDAMTDLDALIYPTVPIAAPPIGTTEIEVEGELRALFPLLTDRALVASLAGAPAITLPFQGFDARPLGIELLGHRGRDRQLLASALAVQGALQ